MDCSLFSFKINKELLIGLTVVITVWIYIRLWRRPRDLPPGPWGLPLIGASFRLSTNLHEDFVKIGKQYGDVFSLYLGNKLYVVLNDADAIHEGFGKMEEFSDRPHGHVLQAVANFKDEIFTFPYSEQWKENKKFALKALRNFGFGTASIESKVLIETNVLHEYLLSKKQAPVALKDILSNVCLNVILSILVDTRYDWDDPWSEKLIRMVHDFFGVFEDGYISILFEFMPTLSKIIFHRQVNNMIREGEEFRKFIKKHIDDHRASLDPVQTRDFLDVNLNEGKLDAIGERALTDTIFILLPDAFQTNGIVLNWIMLYVTAHPEVQRRIHAELDEAVGQGRLLTLSDRPMLPYTEAAMFEAMRTSNCVTLSVSHKPIKDTRFRGFLIPESATILANIFNVHANSRVYPDPHLYKPERYLGESGQRLLREHFMPFSVGRRMCIGESLVRIENFLIFASLMQRFSFSFPSDEPAPSLKPASTGMMLSPHEYKIVVTPR